MVSVVSMVMVSIHRLIHCQTDWFTTCLLKKQKRGSIMFISFKMFPSQYQSKMYQTGRGLAWCLVAVICDYYIIIVLLLGSELLIYFKWVSNIFATRPNRVLDLVSVMLIGGTP